MSRKRQKRRARGVSREKWDLSGKKEGRLWAALLFISFAYGICFVTKSFSKHIPRGKSCQRHQRRNQSAASITVRVKQIDASGRQHRPLAVLIKSKRHAYAPHPVRLGKHGIRLTAGGVTYHGARGFFNVQIVCRGKVFRIRPCRVNKPFVRRGISFFRPGRRASRGGNNDKQRRCKCANGGFRFLHHNTLLHVRFLHVTLRAFLSFSRSRQERCAPIVPPPH